MEENDLNRVWFNVTQTFSDRNHCALPQVDSYANFLISFVKMEYAFSTFPLKRVYNLSLCSTYSMNMRETELITRIEPVGKPYREVCLRSELWHWMAHQPNSWSKHPGTRVEQVLAYCRDEQKYVGCIELLFCLTVTMTFGVQTWKFIGLMDVILPIYQPSFTEIR